MKKTILFHKQETDYTCGPACLKMVFSYFGKDIQEKYIAQILNTNEEIGTSISNILKFLNTHKFNFIVKRNSQIQDLIDLQNDYIIIVYHHMPEYGEDHYAILKNIEDNISFYDPYRGEDYSMSHEYFEEIWFGKNHDIENKLFIGISKEYSEINTTHLDIHLNKIF